MVIRQNLRIFLLYTDPSISRLARAQLPLWKLCFISGARNIVLKPRKIGYSGLLERHLQDLEYNKKVPWWTFWHKI